MSRNFWKAVCEEFDSNLPRLTAVYVKERDELSAYAYPTGESRPGYFFDFSIKTGYDQPPKFKFEFATYEYPSILKALGQNRVLYNRQEYFPSMIRRELSYMNLALTGTERMGRVYDGSFTWAFDFTCNSAWHVFDKDLFSTVTSDEPFSAEVVKGAVVLRFADMEYFIASSDEFELGLYANEMDAKEDLKQNRLSLQNRGHVLIFRHHFTMRPLEEKQFVFGLSREGVKAAKKALLCAGYERKVARPWNKWFASLPKVEFSSRKEEKAYYKSWLVIRNNYYNHPQWGHCVLESLPVYKGIWQWAVPSVEWHSDQNTEYTSQWIKKAMDLLLAAQREDGYVTHAIYIDEEVPGSSWEKSGTIQAPHLAWTALRYYYATGDLTALRDWLPALKKYYDYLCDSRDARLRSLHLWAIFSSFDTGLDTTSAYQRVTFGEEGIPREAYCYPAIFGAERARYEQSLAQICALLGEDGSFYEKEAALTLQAMERTLWDEARGWYGVLHEDGTLDTRVGLDGMFILAYGMVSDQRAKTMRPGLESLIGPYGVRTVAEGEPGFRAGTYWRGASWPKSCSVALGACLNYYPDLIERVRGSIVRSVLRYPSIWECCNASTGELARGDTGHLCTPGMTSNVGAGDIIGALWESHGLKMYESHMALPLIKMERFHHGGLRITIAPQGSGGFLITAEPAEKQSAQIDFITAAGRQSVQLAAGQSVTLF